MSPYLSRLLLIFVAAGKPAPFTPDVTQVVPSVSEGFDLDLLMAGKPPDRFERAMKLKESLPQLGSLNPLQDTEQVMTWLAVTALVESVIRDGQASDENWDLEITRLYREWNSVEQTFRMMNSAMAMVALQAGNDSHPLVKLSAQLAELPAYARRGIRWVAKRRLSAAAPQLRTVLLESLVEVNRREADFQGMWMAAKTLSDLAPSGRSAAYEAEALFELDKRVQAQEALARAEKDGKTEEVARALNRKRLADARRDPANMLGVAEALLALDEPWRVGQLLAQDRVFEAANPKLDEAYIQAQMRSGLNYQAAWAFSLRAGGKPHTRPFLAHRISSGLMMIMREFYATGGRPRFERMIASRVKKDIEQFRPADPKLADLTSLYLDFLRFISAPDGDLKPRQDLVEAVLRFNKENPGDLAGVQMTYLLSQLYKDGPDPWEVVGRFRATRDSKGVEEEFLPVFAGAAVRKALKTRDRKPVNEVIDWIGQRLKKKESMSLNLWQAHLMAIDGLLSDETTITARLQQAANSYGQCLQLWSGSSSARGTPEELCDAAASLATLLMQGQAADQGRSLLDQLKPVCGDYPSAATVSTVMDLAAGKSAEGGADPRKNLEEMLPKLSSEQAKIQAHLWLTAVADAGGDAVTARRHLEAAAAAILSEKERGVEVPLAPDRMSLIAFSGSFNMGAAYTNGNPFGLEIEVSIATRMTLFPPAAVDAARLKAYLKPATQGDKK